MSRSRSVQPVEAPGRGWPASDRTPRVGSCCFAGLRPAAVGLPVLLLVVLVSGPAGGDIVHLRNGRTLEGEVTYRGDEVVVKVGRGSITLKREEVLRVEHVPTPQEEYQERARALRPDDVEGHYRLALWCREQGLKAECEAEARAVLAEAPGHEGAHRLLGHVRFRGRWVSEAHRRAVLAREALPRVRAVLEACREALAASEAPSLRSRAAQAADLADRLTPEQALNLRTLAQTFPQGPLSAERADRLLTDLKEALSLARRVSLGDLRDLSHLRQARRLIADYFQAASADEEARAVAGLRDLGDVSVELAAVLAQEGPFYEPQPAGEQARRIAVAGDSVEYYLVVPSGYDPRRAHPLLVACHGKGGDGRRFSRRWRRACLEHGYLLACPTDPFGERGYGARPLERALVLATVEDVARTYHIDPDRVFLTGTSAGGHQAWDVGLHHADRFAGIIPEAGFPVHEGGALTRYLYLQNAVPGLGIYSIAGELDGVVRPIVEEAHRRLEDLGVEARLTVVPGVGHGYYPSEDEKVFAWMEPRRRNPNPRSVFKRLHHLTQGRAWWVEVTALADPEWDSSKPVKLRGVFKPDISKAQVVELARAQLAQDLPWVRASVDTDNLITVTAGGVARLVVRLSPRLVDFSRPVRIEVNGSVLWEEVVTPEVGVMLGEMKRTWDLGRVYPAAVECDLVGKRAWLWVPGGSARLEGAQGRRR